MNLKTTTFLLSALVAGTLSAQSYPEAKTFDDRTLDLLTPGNPATHHELNAVSTGNWEQALTAKENLPVAIFRSHSKTKEGESIRVAVTALEDVNFSYGESFAT